MYVFTQHKISSQCYFYEAGTNISPDVGWRANSWEKYLMKQSELRDSITQTPSITKNSPHSDSKEQCETLDFLTNKLNKIMSSPTKNENGKTLDLSLPMRYS